MPSRKTSLLAGTALAAGAWAAAAATDRRRLAHDPLREALAAPLGGTEIDVRSADGTVLHARSFGPEKAPAIVLAHGWTESIDFWKLQIHELQRDHHVVAYDLRGHARSERAAGGDYSMEAHGADLGAVLDTVVPEGPVIVAGHSMGAMAMLAWAEDQPTGASGRIDGAALLNTGAGGLISESLVLRPPVRHDAIELAVGRALLSAAAPIPRGPLPLIHRTVRYITMAPGASPAAVEFASQLVLATRNDVRAACGATLTEMDLAHAIEKLDVPTLVIAGAQDRLTPPVHAERLADALPEVVDHALLEGVGHMAALEAPGEVSTRLRQLAATAARQRAAA